MSRTSVFSTSFAGIGDGTNVSADSTNWAEQNGVSSFVRVVSEAWHASHSSMADVCLKLGTFGTRQYAAWTLTGSNLNSSGDRIGVSVFNNAAAFGSNDCYRAYHYANAPGSAGVVIAKVADGAETQIGLTYFRDAAAGDRYIVEADAETTPGSVILTLYVIPSGGSESSLGTRTDSSSPYTTGRPGLCANVSGDLVLGDDFDAGTFTAGSNGTATPGVGLATLNGRTPSTSAFLNVRIREVLVNGSGQVVGSATDIGLRVWYSGICAGAPDVSLNGMTTDANGTTSWSIVTGGLAFNQPIFYVAQNSVSYSHYACGRLVPSYE